MTDKLSLKPLSDRVLLEEVSEDEEQTGGIVLPEEAKTDDFVKAEVRAVGTDTEEIEVSEGQSVLIDSFAGKKLEMNGSDYRIVKADDILAVVE